MQHHPERVDLLCSLASAGTTVIKVSMATSLVV